MAAAAVFMLPSFHCAFAASGEPEKRYAVVELSANFMRESPEYEAEVGTQSLMGTIVEVLDTSRYWVKITSPEPYTAWVNELGLVMMSSEEIEEYLKAPKYICTAGYTHIFSEPSLKSRLVSDFVQGNLVRVNRTAKNGKAEKSGKFLGVILPSGKTGYVLSSDVSAFDEWASERYSRLADADAYRSDIISTAMKFLGSPYMWGGTSIKYVDCSGLTRCAYFANGVLLPRNASQQCRVGENVRIFNDAGEVDWSDLLPGDLIFWGKEATADKPELATHVGIYVGDGRFIHSSQLVRINSLDASADDYYKRRPIRVRRIVTQVDAEGSGIFSILHSPFYF